MPNTAKAPLGVLVEGQLAAGATLEARNHARTAVKKLQNNNGSGHWAYTVASGGVGNGFVVFAPFKTHAELDARKSTGELLSGTGSDANETLTKIESLISNVKRSVLEYVPSLSNPPTQDGPAPGPLVYRIKVVLKPGSTFEAKELAQTVAAAHKNGGLNYWLYQSQQERDTFDIFVPFQKYGDLDMWKSTGDLLGEDATETLTSLDSLIASTERSILEYVPSLSVPVA